MEDGRSMQSGATSRDSTVWAVSPTCTCAAVRMAVEMEKKFECISGTFPGNKGGFERNICRKKALSSKKF